MRRNIYNGILIWSFTIIKAKEPELPLCPTNMQYFPQNLPMHCRMPVGSSRISRSPLDKPPQPLQLPMNGFPAAMPGATPGGGFPGAIPGGMPVPMLGGFPGIPGGMPGPVPGGMLPMLPPPPGPSQKLPVIVMPFYSQDNSAKTPQIQPRQIRHKKHRKNHMKKKPKSYYSDEDSADIDTSDEDSSGSSSNAGWWKNSRQGRRTSHHKSNRRKHRKQELLTPVLQYVTKDGYVIYEKQISKGEAKGWLGGKNNEGNEDGAALKRQREQESREPKDEVETGFLLKEEERAESTTEDKPQVVYKKKNPKRKVFKKHDV